MSRQNIAYSLSGIFYISFFQVLNVPRSSYGKNKSSSQSTFPKKTRSRRGCLSGTLLGLPKQMTPKVGSPMQHGTFAQFTPRLPRSRRNSEIMSPFSPLCLELDDDEFIALGLERAWERGDVSSARGTIDHSRRRNIQWWRGCVVAAGPRCPKMRG